MKNAVDLRDRGRSYLLLALVLIELLNVPGGQLLKGDPSQRREQILHPDLLIRLVGSFANPGLNLVLEPVEQIRFDRFIPGAGQCSEQAGVLGVL